MQARKNAAKGTSRKRIPRKERPQTNGPKQTRPVAVPAVATLNGADNGVTQQAAWVSGLLKSEAIRNHGTAPPSTNLDFIPIHNCCGRQGNECGICFGPGKCLQVALAVSKNRVQVLTELLSKLQGAAQHTHNHARTRQPHTSKTTEETEVTHKGVGQRWTT